MQQILGYFSATIVGSTLGLIGGGGSILTVPILVYIFKIPPVLATAYSLFIVGLTSLFGVLGYIKSKIVNYKVGVSFSIPSFMGVFISRRFIVPMIPQKIISIGSYVLEKNTAILLLFSTVMIFASISMIKGRKNSKKNETTEDKTKGFIVAIQGLLVGVLSGLVGAGGGFLIIPVLVMFANLEMKEAIATSLLIITINSLLGFLGDIRPDVQMDWSFLIGFSIFTITGVLVGSYFSKYVSGEKLKPAFGWFVLVMGIFIILKEGIGGSH